jgi:hypothetical protein
MQHSPLSCYFLLLPPFRPKCLHQHPILEHSQSNLPVPEANFQTHKTKRKSVFLIYLYYILKKNSINMGQYHSLQRFTLLFTRLYSVTNTTMTNSSLMFFFPSTVERFAGWSPGIKFVNLCNWFFLPSQHC